jgi:sulfide dehydrogenase [flavocytochrome c] flavoprotein chain
MAYTNFGEHKADVLNVIPPHHAGNIAKNAGLTNEKGWCSGRHADHGVDRAQGHLGGGRLLRPRRSAGVCRAEVGALCGHPGQGGGGAIIAKLNGQPAPVPYFVNTCYSIAAPDWGFSVVHVYRVDNGKLVYVQDAGGISVIDTPAITTRKAGGGVRGRLAEEHHGGQLRLI